MWPRSQGAEPGARRAGSVPWQLVTGPRNRAEPRDRAEPRARGSPEPRRAARVLLYHFSTLDIPSVPAQLAFFESTLSGWRFEFDESVDPLAFTDQNLERYAAVAMINTCFEPFGKGQPDRPQSEVLQRFLQRGGGLFGTHCASVTFQADTPPALYNQLLGGRGGNGFFDGAGACRVVAQHATAAKLNATFTFNGNLDNTDFLAPDTVVLVKCQWQTDSGKDVAVSWYRNEGPGRVFYTDFAKVDTDLSDPTLGPTHIVPGLAWVLRVGE
jgi:type 1 glutamine amidotransferase